MRQTASILEPLRLLCEHRPLHATICLRLDAGVPFYLASHPTAARLSTEPLPGVTATFDLSEADLAAMLAQELDPTQAFMQGRLRVSGDMGVAMRLAQVMAR